MSMKTKSQKLENLVFGGQLSFIDSTNTSVETEGSSDDDPEEVPVSRHGYDAVEPKPAWVDDEDNVALPAKKKLCFLNRTTDKIKDSLTGSDYVARLKDQFSKTKGHEQCPKWAQPSLSRKRHVSSSDSEPEADSLSSDKFLAQSSRLPQSVIRLKKLRDISYGHRKKNVALQTVEFHRSTQIALAAYQTNTVMLYQIDGKQNSLLHKVEFDQFPVENASFSACGSKFLVGSRLHSHFFYYDMNAMTVVKVPAISCVAQQPMGRFIVSPDDSVVAFYGRDGFIYLLSAKSYELMGTLKMNGAVTAMCFSSDGSYLYTHGNHGEVYVWDQNSRQCIHKFFDAGCLKGTSLAISPDNNLLACGSSSGIVNIYERDTVMNLNEPVPKKAFGNLVTPISGVKFNHSAEMLAMWSNQDLQSVRFAHVSTLGVFSNWPSRSDRIQKPKCLDFSTNSGFVAIGNTTGNLLLYNLQHYGDY